MRDSDHQEALLRSISTEVLISQPLEYVAERHKAASKEKLEAQTYYGVRVEVTIPASKRDKKTKPLQQWALVVLGSGKLRLDRGVRERDLSKVEARLAEIQGSLNVRKYCHRRYAEAQVEKALAKYPALKGMIDCQVHEQDGRLSMTWTRDEKALQHAAILDGKYAIYFNRPTLSDNQVFQMLKSRDIVERRIGNLKGPIVVRPIFLHNDERIQGAIFASMVALLVYSIAERRIRERGISMTGEGLQRLFRDFGGSLLTFADRSQMVTLPSGDKWQRQVLTALRVPMTPATPVQLPDTYSSFSDATAAREPPWGAQVQASILAGRPPPTDPTSG
jgi:hypothetical protein